MRKKYPSDLSDKGWSKVRYLFENEARGRHLQVHSKRELVNAVLYLNKTGCQWRQLPNDFPNYKTVFSFYKRSIENGLWEKVCASLVKKASSVRTESKTEL